MKIIAHFDCPPISSNSFDWSAIDADTYGGEPTDKRGFGKTRAEAIIDLIYALDLMPDIPSVEPCSAVNPQLWSAFCTLKNRPQDTSNVWTESDVVQSIDEMYKVLTDDRAAVYV